MTPKDVAGWMLLKITTENCVYQDDVVDYILRAGASELLRENSEGNLVLGKDVLAAFLKISADSVVWVKPDFYWRMRVSEDEPGREARG
jgi:hypothetical protein